jgi:hypothetical protein
MVVVTYDKLRLDVTLPAVLYEIQWIFIKFFCLIYESPFFEGEPLDNQRLHVLHDMAEMVIMLCLLAETQNREKTSWA